MGVIRVNHSVCLRLGNVGRSLGAGDQVDVRGAIQGHQQFFDSLADALKESAARGRAPTAFYRAAGDHDCSGPEVLLLVDAELLDFGTVKPDWHERVVGCGNNVILNLYWCGGRGQRANAHQSQGDAGQRYAQND